MATKITDKSITGYACLVKHKKDKYLVKHRVSDIDFFPYVIFETLEEALEYGKHMHHIRKVTIKVNKKDLQDYEVYD